MSTPVRLEIYRTSIPMRSFEHAAATRTLSEGLVVRVALADGRSGWGETLPRPYVTGETLDTAIGDIRSILWSAARAGAPLPTQTPDGRCILAARCGLQLALANASASAASSAARIDARISGVLGSADPAKTSKRLRLMRWFGLKDFKLKLGLGEAIDRENLRRVHAGLGSRIAAGRASLRVDVNGGWSADETPDRVGELVPYGVCCVEQPTFCPAGDLIELARRCPLPLMADESLLTLDDARVLVEEPRKVWWNVRISKNGGADLAGQLLELARTHHVTVSQGCMVGETGILSTAQRRLLAGRCDVRFAEGNYGRWLLADDLTQPSPRFGYGGRLRPPGPLRVDPAKLRRYAQPVTVLD